MIREAISLKKEYELPELERITFRIRNNVLLPGSVESGGDIIETKNDDIPDPFEDQAFGGLG